MEIENLSNEFGICREGTTEVRSVQIDNLTLFFTSTGNEFSGEGKRLSLTLGRDSRSEPRLRRLGHSSARITLDVYGRLFKGHVAAADRLDKAVSVAAKAQGRSVAERCYPGTSRCLATGGECQRHRSGVWILCDIRTRLKPANYETPYVIRGYDKIISGQREAHVAQLLFDLITSHRRRDPPDEANPRHH